MARNVISYYELTEDFRRLIEHEHRELITFTAISRLRSHGLLDMLRKVRALKAPILTVAVERSSQQLVGPLVLVAAITGSGRIEVLWPDGALEEISCGGVAGWLFKISVAQVSSRWAYLKAKRRVKTFTDCAATSNVGRSQRPSADVLYLDANLPLGPAVGGSVGHTRGVIEGLVGKGYRVDYASSKPIPTNASNTRWLKIPTEEFLAFPPELNCYAFNESFDKYAESRAKEKSYAFIYQRMSVHNFTGAVLRRNLSIPLILEYNGSEAWAAANWNKKLRLHEMAVSAELASLRNADCVVTVSHALAEQLAAAGVHREKIVAYPNCIDPQIFDPSRFSDDDIRDLRERLQIRGDAYVATFIGTFGAWHGIDFLAKAVRRLIDTDSGWLVEHKLHFLLIGDGLKMAEVQELLAEKPYADFVTLTGMIPQNSAPAYLAASDLFLSPHVPNEDGSEFFGSPTKLFEYMAMDRPIIASDLAQIGEILRGSYFETAGGFKGPLAELFTPGSEHEFLTALRKTVENPIPAREMAKNARDVALGSFTWSHHVDAIVRRANELGILA